MAERLGVVGAELYRLGDLGFLLNPSDASRPATVAVAARGALLASTECKVEGEGVGWCRLDWALCALARILERAMAPARCLTIVELEERRMSRGDGW